MKKHRSWAGRPQSFPKDRGSFSGAETGEGALECSLDELREFLEADLVDVPVDVDFKENLRNQLWDMVETRNRVRAGRLKEN
jgi:hypothetical protein